MIAHACYSCVSARRLSIMHPSSCIGRDNIWSSPAVPPSDACRAGATGQAPLDAFAANFGLNDRAHSGPAAPNDRLSRRAGGPQAAERRGRGEVPVAQASACGPRRSALRVQRAGAVPRPPTLFPTLSCRRQLRCAAAFDLFTWPDDWSDQLMVKLVVRSLATRGRSEWSPLCVAARSWLH